MAIIAGGRAFFSGALGAGHRSQLILKRVTEQLVPMQTQKPEKLQYATEALQHELLSPCRATGSVQRVIVICRPPRADGPKRIRSQIGHDLMHRTN